MFSGSIQKIVQYATNRLLILTAYGRLPLMEFIIPENIIRSVSAALFG
jgi:hypothetical protein